MEAAVSYDLGLRSFLNAVYARMGLGLLVTALLAWISSVHPVSDIFFKVGAHGGLDYTILGWIVSFFPIFLIIGLGVNKSKETSGIVFWGTTACFGLSLGAIVMKFSGASLASAFLETAITFGAMSFFGYTTKRNLGAVGNFCFFALIGVFIALIAGAFMHSHVFNVIINIVGILVFAGLIAFDTQAMKERYDDASLGEVDQYDINMAALNLYLNFVNVFLFFLRLAGLADDD